MLEDEIKARGCAEVTQKHDCVLTNNPNGVFYTRDARQIRTKPKGYPDTTGWKSIVITPQMVGLKIALFVAIEWKSLKGVKSPEQKQWIKRMQDDGCLAGFAKSTEEAVAIVRRLDQ